MTAKVGLCALAWLLPLAGGCGPATPPGAVAADEYVNGRGEAVSLSSLEGHFVWIDYAAEWCAACAPQTRAIKAVSRNSPGKLVFVTVMTSERGGYGHPPDALTASRWAARFELDPARVWAKDLSAWTLPRHRLLSPRGQVLLDHTGQLTASQIRQQIRNAVR